MAYACVDDEVTNLDVFPSFWPEGVSVDVKVYSSMELTCISMTCQVLQDVR